MEPWKIVKNRARCDRPGCPLAGEQEFYAILELPECVRLERCASCFHELQRADAAMPFHWKVRRTQSGTRPVLDLESLRLLFDRLGEAVPTDAAPDAVAEATAEEAEVQESAESTGMDPASLRYLVALLLLRKRRLKMVDPKNDEQERADLLVVDPKLPEMEPVALIAPEFDPERLDSLREELMAAIGEDTETEAAHAETES